MKILIFGFYKQANVGDDLFELIFKRIFNTNTTPNEIIIANPCNTEESFVENYIKHSELDCIICGGGDIITDYFLNRLYKFKKLWESRYKKIIPYYAISIGLSFPENIIENTSHMIDIFDHIIVRNKNDAEILSKRFNNNNEINVEYLPDIVETLRFVYPELMPNNIVKKTNTIGFFLARPILSEERNTYYPNIIKQLAHCIDQLVEKYNYDIELVPFNYSTSSHESDYIINNDVFEEISNKNKDRVIVLKSKDPLEITKLVSKYKINVCMRFHAHILSYVYKIPILSISFTNKTNQFMIDNKLDKYMMKLPKNAGESWPCNFNHNDFFNLFDTINKNIETYYNANHNVIKPEQYTKIIYSRKQRETAPFLLEQYKIDEICDYIIHKIAELGYNYAKNMNLHQSLYNTYSESVFKLLQSSKSISLYWKLITGIEINRTDDKLKSIMVNLIDSSLTGQIGSSYNYGLCEQIYDCNLYDSISWILRHYHYNYGKHNSKFLIFENVINLKDIKIKCKKPNYDNSICKINFGKIQQFTMKGLHRAGWEYVVNNICVYHHDDNAEIFIDCYLDKTFHWTKDFNIAVGVLPYKSSWIGFVHHTPDESYSEYNTTKMINDPIFIESLIYCKGIFVMTKYLQKWFQNKLSEKNINIPVFKIYHPTELVEEKFTMKKFLNNPNKKIVQIGGWMRDSYSIYKLSINPNNKLRLKKAILRGKGMENYFCPNDFAIENILDLTTQKKNVFMKGLINNLYEQSKSVIVLEKLPNNEYDKLLEENIIFLNLIDASACNTLLECIARNTPLLVNKIDPIIELLGKDYPLYYTHIAEVNEIICDTNKIIKAHEHISKINKNKISIEYFLNKFNNCLKQI